MDCGECQEAGTLGIARTRQSRPDKLAGFRTRNGSFLHAHLRSLTWRSSFYDVLSSDHDIIRFARDAYVIYSPRRRRESAVGPVSGHRYSFFLRLYYGCASTCVCVRACVEGTARVKDPVSSREGRPGVSELGTTITPGLPRLIIRVYSQRVAKKRSEAERSGTERTSRYGTAQDEERMAGRLQGTARMLAVCLVYLVTLLGELPAVPVVVLPASFLAAPTLYPCEPPPPHRSWTLPWCDHSFPLSPQSHSLKNAPYGAGRDMAVHWSAALLRQ